MAAIGTRADSLSAIPEARDSADRALRALGAASGQRLVAEFGEVQAEALLLRFAEACQGDASLRDGPLARLREHDRRRGVHPNTVRYRLRQIQRVGGFDLADSTQRLALILQVNLPVVSS